MAKQQDHHALACWAAECAARVLYIFEKKTEDLRARDAIDAGKGWIRGEIAMVDARKGAFAAHAAAREARSCRCLCCISCGGTRSCNGPCERPCGACRNVCSESYLL
ncbi:putative immunity protein [Paenibacillus amylolyticus]|uniref:putative immunity protein n=1 Tax=Paenibacillus amylolyticus TaxID=1451 RepID=UPI0034C5F297